MKTKQIEVQFKSAEFGDLSDVTELGARATFSEHTAIITCNEDLVNQIEDMLESDNNVVSYVVHQMRGDASCPMMYRVNFGNGQVHYAGSLKDTLAFVRDYGDDSHRAPLQCVWITLLDERES